MLVEANKTNSKIDKISFIVFFIAIFISDDTFNFGTNDNYLYFIFKYLVYFLLTFYLIIKSNFKFFSILTKGSITFYFLVFSVLLTLLMNLDFSGGHIYQIWLLFLAILIVNHFTVSQFIYTYQLFIYFLSIISLLVFILSNISLSLFEIFPIQQNSNGATLYNLYLSVIFTDSSFIRNTSIFREPGVFMIYLNFAVIFELFFKDKVNKRYLLIFIISILTTFSTAAFIILGTIFIGYLFTHSKNINTFKNKFLILFFLLLTLSIFLITDEFYKLVFEKIGKDNISDGSSLARGVSIVANLNIFLDNFLYGVGINDFPTKFQQYTLKLVGFSLDVGNNTNTITTLFAIYGVLYGSFFLYMIIIFAKKATNTIFSRFLVLLSLLMLFSNEQLRYSLMFTMLLMFGLNKLFITKYNNG